MLALFSAVAVLHFALSVAGIAMVLPAGFETQGGAGFWAAPGKMLLVWTSAVMLAPLALLPHRGDFGFLEIAAVSVLFGLAAVGLAWLWRRRKMGTDPIFRNRT